MRSSYSEKVTVGLLDGQERVGRLMKPYSPALEKLPLLLAPDPKNLAETSVRLTVPTQEVMYVAFHRFGGEAVERPQGDLSRVAVHPRNRDAFVVDLCEESDTDEGFFAYPVDVASPYREYFFYSDTVARREETSTIGGFLIKQGLISKRDLAAGLAKQKADREKPLGAYLVERDSLTPDELDTAVEKQKEQPDRRLGEIVVSEGLASLSDVQAALEAQKSARHKRLGEVLIEMQVLTELQLMVALSRKLQMPLVDLDDAEIDEELVEATEGELFEKHEMLPIRSKEAGEGFDFVISDPFGAEAPEILALIFGGPVRFHLSLPSQLHACRVRVLGLPPGLPALGSLDVNDYVEAELTEDEIADDEEAVLNTVPTLAPEDVSHVPGDFKAARIAGNPHKEVTREIRANDVLEVGEMEVEAEPSGGPPPPPPASNVDELCVSDSPYESIEIRDSLPSEFPYVRPQVTADIEGPQEVQPIHQTVDLTKVVPTGSLPPSRQDLESADPEDVEKSAAMIVRIVDHMLKEASRRGATDVHIEPNGPSDDTVIRFRIGTTCVSYSTIPAAHRGVLVAAVLASVGLEPSSKGMQRGRGLWNAGGVHIELSVVAVPTFSGDVDLTIRLLPPPELLTLNALGLSSKNAERISEMISCRSGLVVVTGSRRSGRVPMMHAMLESLNAPTRKLWTVEDPVQFTQEGLRQIQVDREQGLDIEACVRAAMASDADVIMISHLDDERVVRVALEAANAGHLVIAGYTSQDAIDAVRRLKALVGGAFLSSVLVGVVGVGIAPARCTECHQSGGASTLSGNSDCNKCYGSGLNGTAGIHETVLATASFSAGLRIDEPIEVLAADTGYVPIASDRAEKAKNGICTPG